ncbi:LysR family transcriptional regulator [Phaeobacter sp. J2-8]|uniref:LysR family transcriptional regulator n=1 Tax=Phaeobacter sp. J2-8 TaxID=2931394 RepID=UPI001FD48352|nr:LysR family transcriptional regulator [Phaeobacter sp. J2-8]MCJ7872115.1 LysR family transcriptional regulator [Phaeobacter sp. J2-8]
MQIDPRHLIQLATIVQCGSFGAAAAKLGVAQPALSKNMKKLEERLGAPIFEKIGRQSVATDLGTTFARFGLMMLAADEQARAYAQHVSTGQTGSLLIGTPPSLADNVLAPILADFLATHTGCRVELRVGLLVELETQLSTGQINLVVGPSRPHATDLQLETETLADDMLGVVCRKAHPLTRKAEILPQDLEAQRWVAHSRGSYLRLQTEDGLAKFGVTSFDIALDTDSTETAYKAVAKSDLITVMPRLPTLLSSHSAAIEFLPIDSTAFLRPIGIVQRASHTRSSLEISFLRHLRKAVQSRDIAIPGNRQTA